MPHIYLEGRKGGDGMKRKRGCKEEKENKETHQVLRWR